MPKGCYNCRHDTEGTLLTGHPCETCLSTYGKDVPPTNWEAAENYKPDTNADRIRAMTDEELGRFLAGVENRRSAAGGGAIWKGAAHAIEWLRQPVKED